MACYYEEKQIENTISWISPIVNSKDRVDRARLFTLRLGERGGMGDNIYQQCSGVRCQPGRWPEKTARLIGKETDERRTSNVQHRTSNKCILSVLKKISRSDSIIRHSM